MDSEDIEVREVRGWVARWRRKWWDAPICWGLNPAALELQRCRYRRPPYTPTPVPVGKGDMAVRAPRCPAGPSRDFEISRDLHADRTLRRRVPFVKPRRISGWSWFRDCLFTLRWKPHAALKPSRGGGKTFARNMVWGAVEGDISQYYNMLGSL
ncbi:hypothetical protein BGX38DRAFT_1145817 [Terfezia claveryi]|nr:hypothetical protein BGX38DRAFT_1145817 [Terfezia claveryi]